MESSSENEGTESVPTENDKKEEKNKELPIEKVSDNKEEVVIELDKIELEPTCDKYQETEEEIKDEKLQEIAPNFRVAIRNKAGVPTVYRSSRLEHLSEEDIHFVSNVLGVRTILDLRSDREVDHKSETPLNNSYQPVKVDTRRDTEKPLKRKHSAAAGADSGSSCQQKRLLLSLIGGPMMVRMLWLLPGVLWKVAGYLCLVSDALAGTKLLNRFIVHRILNSLGLLQFNKMMLDTCTKEIGIALSKLKNDENFPLIVNCAQGKDRTGLLVALLQLMTHHPMDEIRHNYSLSQELLPEDLLGEIGKKYHLLPEFATSEPETIEALMNHIMETHGSVDKYLSSCGLSDDDLSLIKDNLVSESPEAKLRKTDFSEV